MSEAEDKREQLLRSAFDYREDLLAYSRSLLGNYAAAEDAVQEAMLVVVKKYDQFTEGTSLLAWCRSIVRIEVLRAKQRHNRERSFAERLLNDSVDAAFEQFQESTSRDERNVRREALGRCVEQLSDQGQRVMKARFVDDLGYPQIGERLGMTIEAVRKALFRCRKQVKTCVESKLRTAQ